MTETSFDKRPAFVGEHGTQSGSRFCPACYRPLGDNARRIHRELSAALAPFETEVTLFDDWPDHERIQFMTLGELRRLVAAAKAVLA